MRTDHDISPPPLKRRRLETAQDDTPIPTQALRAAGRAVRIFSWNINGIQAFIPASTAPIFSFFRPSSFDENQETTSRTRPRQNGLRTFLSRHDWPDVLFLQELKVNQKDIPNLTRTLKGVNTPLDSQDEVTLDRSYEYHTCLPQDNHNVKGFQRRLYGVGTLLRCDFARDYVERVRDVDWDVEGRVSIVEMIDTLQSINQDDKRPQEPRDQMDSDVGKATTDINTGHKRKPLALINVYAVNGTDAAYRSPQTGRITGTRHDHKLAFHTRLRDECLALESKGFHVIIAGDLNIARGTLDGYPNLRTSPVQHCINRADFNMKFFNKQENKKANAYVTQAVVEDSRTKVQQEEPDGKCFNGIDVFRAIYERKRKFTYHPRTSEWGKSCDRVDLIIASKGLWDSGRVVRTGILDSPLERGPSDHVPLWVEVMMEEMESPREVEARAHNSDTREVNE